MGAHLEFRTNHISSRHCHRQQQALMRRQCQVAQQYYYSQDFARPSTIVAQQVCNQAAPAQTKVTGLSIQDESQVRIPSKAELQNMMICGTAKSFWDDQNERQCNYYKINDHWVFESQDQKTSLILKTNCQGCLEWQSLSESEAKQLADFKNRKITLEDQELNSSNPEHCKLIASRLNYSPTSVNKLGRVIFDKDDHSHPMLVQGNANDGYKFYIHDRKADGSYDWIAITQDNYPRHLEALNAKYPHTISALSPSASSSEIDLEGYYLTSGADSEGNRRYEEIIYTINHRDLAGAKFYQGDGDKKNYHLVCQDLDQLPAILVEIIMSSNYLLERHEDSSLTIKIPRDKFYKSINNPLESDVDTSTNLDPFGT